MHKCKSFTYVSLYSFIVILIVKFFFFYNSIYTGILNFSIRLYITLISLSVMYIMHVSTDENYNYSDIGY